MRSRSFPGYIYSFTNKQKYGPTIPPSQACKEPSSIVTTREFFDNIFPKYSGGEQTSPLTNNPILKTNQPANFWRWPSTHPRINLYPNAIIGLGSKQTPTSKPAQIENWPTTVSMPLRARGQRRPQQLVGRLLVLALEWVGSKFGFNFQDFFQSGDINSKDALNLQISNENTQGADI